MNFLRESVLVKKELKKVEKYMEDFLDFEHKELKESSLHYLRAGGKRIRPTFVILAGNLFLENQNDRDKLIPLAACIELIHMTSLIHDDVIDKSMTRRGEKTLRAIWGNKFSVHVGDYILAKTSKLIDPKEEKEIAKSLSRVSLEMCKGEIIQLHSAFDTEQSFKDYLYRIKRKTALLISASCKVGAIVAGAEEKEVRAVTKFGDSIGMAFQIRDDILDFVSDKNKLGKPAAGDLKQGILTLPTLFALQKNNEEAKRLQIIIERKFLLEGDLDEALRIIKDNDGIKKASLIMNKYIEKAKKTLEFLPDKQYIDKMSKLADYISERKF